MGEERERERGLITMLGHYTQKIILPQAEKATLCSIRLVVSYNQFNGSLASHLCVQSQGSMVYIQGY